MSQILFTLLLLAFGCNTFAQHISIDTLLLPVADRFNNAQHDTLRFPLIRTGNLKIDTLINKDLKNRFTNDEFTDLPTDSTLIYWATDQIVYLGFEVTYIKNGLISLNISAEGCGAHCFGWTEYFTYNYTTGKHITIDEIIDTTGKFRTMVVADKDKQYEAHRTELKRIFIDKESELVEDIYEWVLEYYNDCDNSFQLHSFALHSTHLEIIENCQLPNAIKNMTPVIELKYPYADIKKHLKIKY